MIVKCNQRFTKIQDLEARRSDFETARCLQSQAFRTKKCLEALKESGISIPHETINLFAEQEKEFEEEVARLTIGEIPKELLCLSRLHLPSPFLNENVLVAIDPYGSNTNLIDSGTTTILQTPSTSQGDHTNERLNEPTGRELGELSVRERGDVSGVERTEDAFEPTIAMTVPNPAPAVVNLAVGEEAPTPTLGASNEDPTLPRGEDRTGSDFDDLFELSDSSAGEDGRDKSNEQVPESNLLGTEEDLGESSAKEQGNIDGVENPPDLTTDRTEDVSPIGAQVVGEGLDHVED